MNSRQKATRELALADEFDPRTLRELSDEQLARLHALASQTIDLKTKVQNLERVIADTKALQMQEHLAKRQIEVAKDRLQMQLDLIRRRKVVSHNEIELISRAIDPVAWRWIDSPYTPRDHPALPLTRRRLLEQAEAAWVVASFIAGEQSVEDGSYQK